MFLLAKYISITYLNTLIMKNMISVSVVISCFLLSGCVTTKVSNVTGSYNSIEATLDNSSDELFFLNSASPNKKIITNAKANNAKLTFALPKEYKSQKKEECYFISTANGDVVGFVYGSQNGFTNPLVYEYAQAVDKMTALQAGIVVNQNECIKKYGSEKPILACSPDEKTSKSIAICLINNLGCEGFSGISGSLVRTMFGRGVIKFLSGTSCDAIANDLLGKDESVLANAAKSLALGILATHGGLIGMGIAGGIKIADFKECIDAVQSKCAEKYNTYIDSIKIYPECQNNMAAFTNKENEVSDSKESLTAELNAQSRTIEELTKQKLNLVPNCVVP
jgi:hypothetical protein